MLPALPALLLLAKPVAPPSMAELAPYLKMVTTQTDAPGRVACRDADMAAALKREGVSVDARSRVAWATTASQAQGFTQEGKFVVVGERGLLSEGASLALIREHGRLVLVLHRRNAQNAGIQLSDALLKLAQVL